MAPASSASPESSALPSAAVPSATTPRNFGMPSLNPFASLPPSHLQVAPEDLPIRLRPTFSHPPPPRQLGIVLHYLEAHHSVTFSFIADEGDTCDVDAQHRIACGNPAISEVACHLKGCCFDAPKRVECTRDLFSIVIPKDVTVPPLNLSSVSLANGRASECSPKVRTAAFIVFRFPVSACGTTQVVRWFFLGGELHVECRFAGDAELPFQVLVNTPAPPSLVVKAGVLNMEMRIAKGKWLEQLYSTWYAKADYPVLKFLRQPVFVEVRVLNRTDAHINLMLYDCWATPSPDSDHRTQWRILVNGWFQTLVSATAATNYICIVPFVSGGRSKVLTVKEMQEVWGRRVIEGTVDEEEGLEMGLAGGKGGDEAKA
uniref:Zona pellucida sperm-binding protein 4 n=1 Tax=Callorhinchus milii TaxID=7868 RepID=A0A4W3IAW8_CALMI